MVKGDLRTGMGTESTPPVPVEEEKINEVTADPKNENGNDLSQNVKHVKKAQEAAAAEAEARRRAFIEEAEAARKAAAEAEARRRAFIEEAEAARKADAEDEARRRAIAEAAKKAEEERAAAKKAQEAAAAAAAAAEAEAEAEARRRAIEEAEAAKAAPIRVPAYEDERELNITPLIEQDVPDPDNLTQNVNHTTNKTPGLTESVRNAKHEYVRLILHFESELIKHKLAFRYFDFRSFYFMFLPVTLIATLITIIGFLISGVQNDEGSGGGADEATGSVEFSPLLTGSSKQVWSLVVGILGAISTLFNSIGKRTNYQSQADMHKSAVKALEKLCMTVDFEREWFERDAFNAQLDLESGEATKKLTPDLKSHQASFKAMLDACCDSPVPYQVEQAFTVLEQVYTRQELKNTDKLSDAAPLKFYYHKLWKEHSTYWLWPLKSPSITISAKYKEWKKEMTANLYSD